MKKSNKKKIEEFIRVDHAGERGAIKIYEGQLLALSEKIRPPGWAGDLARWSEYSTCPRFRFYFVPFLGAGFFLAREIHGGEQRPGCGVVQCVAAGIPLRLLLSLV